VVILIPNWFYGESGTKIPMRLRSFGENTFEGLLESGHFEAFLTPPKEPSKFHSK
jgi:hypothetical protein